MAVTGNSGAVGMAGLTLGGGYSPISSTYGLAIASGREGDVHREWADDFSEALAPFALPGGYANLLTSEDVDQIPFTYGDNIFR